MDSDLKQSLAMICLAGVAIVAIIWSNCDFPVVAGCAGAIATLGGVIFGQANSVVKQ